MMVYSSEVLDDSPVSSAGLVTLGGSSVHIHRLDLMVGDSAFRYVERYLICNGNCI